MGDTLKRDCVAGDVLMLSSLFFWFSFCNGKKEKKEEDDKEEGRNLKLIKVLLWFFVFNWAECNSEDLLFVMCSVEHELYKHIYMYTN